MTADKQANGKLDELNCGDRLWLWSPGPPSELEKQIADLFSAHTDTQKFHVQVFSWGSTPMQSTRQIRSQLHKVTDSALQRFIGIHDIGAEVEVSIPTADVTFTQTAQAGAVNITTRTQTFKSQTLITIGCKQEDYDQGHGSLLGSFDAIGYMSLIFGSNIFHKPVISAYFDTKLQKFIHGELHIVESRDEESAVHGLGDFSGIDKFDISSDKSHAILWFAGKGFVEVDRASKIVFYHSALELACSGNIQNYIRWFYKKSICKELAEKTVKSICSLRNNLVHRGKLGEWDRILERQIQLILLDILITDQSGQISDSALFALYDVMKRSD